MIEAWSGEGPWDYSGSCYHMKGMLWSSWDLREKGSTPCHASFRCRDRALTFWTWGWEQIEAGDGMLIEDDVPREWACQIVNGVFDVVIDYLRVGRCECG